MKDRSSRHAGTLRQFEILLALHETGSITGAAEALSLTQPSVSMQLRKLADTLGVSLYSQVGRQLQLSDAGLAVVQTARELIDSLDGLHATLADLKGMKAGHLRIGMVTTAEYFVPRLLGEFAAVYPGITVDMTVANRREIINRLTEGVDDFCVFSQPPEDDAVETRPFLPNPLVGIAARSHALTRRKDVPLDEFASQALILREVGSGTRSVIEDHFRHHGVDLQVQMTIDSNEAIKHAVVAGLGVSIVSGHSLVRGGHRGLSELRVATLPIVTYWHFARLKSKRASIVTETFFDYVEREGRQQMLRDLITENPAVAPYIPSSEW